MYVIQHKKRSNFKKLLYSIIIRTRERVKICVCQLKILILHSILVTVAQKIRIKS